MNGHQPILIDIDLDFLFEGTGTILEEPDKQIWCSAEMLADTLLPAKFLEKEVWAFLDHHISLALWDKYGIQQALCLHIDAHRDIYGLQNDSASKSSGIRGKWVGCGDYLFHAIREGIVQSVIQVIPDGIHYKHAVRDIMKSGDEEIYRAIQLTRLKHLRHILSELCVENIRLITVALSPNWIPPHHWMVIESFLTLIGLPESDCGKFRISVQKRWKQIADGKKMDKFFFPYETISELKHSKHNLENERNSFFSNRNIPVSSLNSPAGLD